MKRQLIELDSFQIKVRCLFKVADNKAIKDTYKLSEKDSLMIENLKLDNELKKLQLQKTTTP